MFGRCDRMTVRMFSLIVAMSACANDLMCERARISLWAPIWEYSIKKKHTHTHTVALSQQLRATHFRALRRTFHVILNCS